ncbi:hypothetical protein [Actinomycetospora chiangmaiensis]|uniref:hypothetical protein n=1 Tax=Actinomycetospora chiangmaiensis TaxID=402650 RepID=UPI00035D9809|nr:hypothetical protein [Actinomycetospora chiangmaiensis]
MSSPMSSPTSSYRPIPPTWVGLEPAQADGRACVICGHSYVVGYEYPPVPVGRAHATGATVMACASTCTPAARARVA